MIKDSFAYSRKFLESLESTGIKNVQLIDNLFILDSTEQYFFPMHINIFNMAAFFGQHEDVKVKLLVERIRQTTIVYNIYAGKGIHPDLIQEGTADIPATFYLNRKSDVNEHTGKAYIVDEYIDQHDGCRTSIRIDKENGEKKLLARFSKTCEGQLVPFVTEQPLMLMEK